MAPVSVWLARTSQDKTGAQVQSIVLTLANETMNSLSLTIIFRGKRRTMDYVEGDTVLESARRAGLSPPFSCEAGNCATCMAFLQEGSVTMRANEALEPDEVEEGFILTCQSVPDGDIVVDYDSL